MQITQNGRDRPLALSVCLIVRNEELHLPQCLESVRGLWNELIVVDTGSTDATPRIAADHGAKVVPFDFSRVDFAAARNHAIASASGEWILMLDADETLVPPAATLVKALIAQQENIGYFCERHNHLASSGTSFTDHVVRLFPNWPGYRYRGRVHETIDASILSAGGALRKSEIHLNHKFSEDPAKRRSKNIRYIEILKEELAAHPDDDTRLDFLAAEYHQLAMFDHAALVAEHIARVRENDPRAHLFAGVYRLLYQPDFQRARIHFNRALELRPGYPEAQDFLQTLDQREREREPIAG